MKGPRLTKWNRQKHPEHDDLLTLVERVGQVWEDCEGWIYFIVGDPQVVTYESNGRPFQYEHHVFIIDDEGVPVDWKLYETNDRPLELNDVMIRLA